MVDKDTLSFGLFLAAVCDLHIVGINHAKLFMRGPEWDNNWIPLRTGIIITCLVHSGVSHAF